MIKTKQALSYLFPSITAICLLALDIYISHRIHDRYYAANEGCGPSPSPVLTIALALFGFAISIYGVWRAFKQHHKWLGALGILLTLIVVLGGLAAWVALSFELCF